MFDKLKFHGSRYRLNLATCTELREVADEALNSGFYSPALVDTALDAEDNLLEIGSAFMDALAELKVVVPESIEDCIWGVLHYSIQQVATLAVEPEVGLARIMEVYRVCSLYEYSQKFVGDSHDIQNLIGAYWEYDGIWERYFGDEFQKGQEQARDLDKDVIERCQVWIRKHAVEVSLWDG
ncbi:MAG: hypothetical protein NW224_13395 [Leptolyngbyaceae cyanobacterium bins.302]|nr:hypothetical protein [Leptolyngbyaceae cyanobacterium bins.302]